MNTLPSSNLIPALAIAILAAAVPANAQNRFLEEHRERRENIVDGIGRAILNIFSSEEERFDPNDIYEDDVYEGRSRRNDPPGWNAPFPPPSDMLTPAERYELYRREQQRRYQRPPREEVARKPLKKWEPEPVRNKSQETGLTVDGPNFEESPTNGPIQTMEPQALIVIPQGARENRRAVLPTPKALSDNRIPPPPIPKDEEELTIGNMPPITKPAPKVEKTEEKMVIGNQSSEPKSNLGKIPLTTEFTTSSGGSMTLADLLQGQNAVMIDFWATWSGESMASLSNINTLKAEMQALGIAVVGMNFDGNADTVERVRRGQEIDVPWLLEPRDRPFSQGLGIHEVPHRVLIDHSGNVRFSGSPTDDALRVALDDIVNQNLDSNQQ